jgi:hypothetical protein
MIGESDLLREEALMTTQNVDYAASPVPAATQDTGGTDAAAIRPILNGEVATQATLQRPDENLRARTEVIRRELEALKYLADADRALHMQIEPAPGAVTWNGTVAGGGGGDGKFTITTAKNLVVRPLLAPALSTPAKIVNRTVRLQTNSVVAFGIDPPRAYSGANKISVQFAGGDGQALAVSVSGTPANKLRVTVNTNPGTGTTKTALIDYLNADATFQGLGLTASLDSGVGSDIFAPSVTFVDGDPEDYAVFAGAADAERHVITQAGLANFFAQPADVNLLQEGDVLAIGYDQLVNPTPGVYTGRRQSLADAPESVENVVDDNLFIVRLHPEKLPIAIPVAMVFDNQLILADGTVATPSVETALTGGGGTLPPVVLPDDPPKFLLMAADGQHTWSIITEEMIVKVITISAFSVTSGTPLELGDSVAGPTFTATTANDGNNGPDVSAVLTNNSGNGENKNVLADFAGESTANFNSDETYTYVAPGANGSVVFTLTVTDAGSPTPAIRTVTLPWYRRAYVGATAVDIDASDFDPFLKELMTKDGLADVSVTANPPIGGANFQGQPANRATLFAGKAFRFQVTPVSQYVYIAYDAAFGDLTSIRDKNNSDFNVLGAFTKVATGGDTAVTTENGANIPEDYIVYRSNNLLSGPIDYETA